MSRKQIIIADTLFRRALRNTLYTILLPLVFVLGACRDSGGPPNEPNESDVTGTLQPGETSLFDGRALGQWKITDFGDQGNVYVKDGSIFLQRGNYLTGVTWAGPVVRMNYEISLEAMRVTGSDFFCGLTFPVDANSCSLILGGWGGGLVGISSLDYYDASENETTRFVEFENGRWYDVRVRVTPGKIEAWLDDEKIVDVETTGRVIDTRIEVEQSKPLGIASYSTTGAIRNIRLRTLSD